MKSVYASADKSSSTAKGLMLAISILVLGMQSVIPADCSFSRILGLVRVGWSSAIFSKARHGSDRIIKAMLYYW